MRSPTIACTPLEASCTGKESVIRWTASTSSWGEQSYATQSLLTAWSYTLVHVEEFIHFNTVCSRGNVYGSFFDNFYSWETLQSVLKLLVVTLTDLSSLRLGHWRQQNVEKPWRKEQCPTKIYCMITEIWLLQNVLFPDDLSSFHLPLWPSLASMTKFIMQNAFFCLLWTVLNSCRSGSVNIWQITGSSCLLSDHWSDITGPGRGVIDFTAMTLVKQINRSKPSRDGFYTIHQRLAIAMTPIHPDYNS